MKQEKESLDILFPLNFDDIGGEKINLRPFVFGKWPEVIAKSVSIVKTFLKVLSERGEETLDINLSDAGIEASADLFTVVSEIVMEGGEELYDILAISARKDRAWVNELEGEDGIKLLIGTIAVNKDFFTKKVAPMLKTVMKSRKTAELPGEQLPKD
ncbi:hypothetical protein [Pelosinus fermentans]|uniref:Uncharacterized protein n=1 Tax=Pelosinus fermentans JBW45 TaxID=1192197 RepID=I9NM89_9FIRM|nr:hypothetical protein [Pelosinus fermentans]AJQ26918.1 hypothetical protein JBW_01568 [Pelosinus fermentans JBW45]